MNNQPGGGSIYIQFWRLNYPNQCPPGWNYVPVTAPNTVPGCFTNSPATSVPNIPISKLADLSITGVTANGGSDSVTLSTGDALYTTFAADSTLGMAQYWNAAEFNIFGDSNVHLATLDASASIQAYIKINDGTHNRPRCVLASTTAETNNLNLLTPCCPDFGASAQITFQEYPTVSPGLPCSTPQTDVTGISPTFGSTVGGNSITVSGNGFSTWGPYPTVYFGSTPAASTYCDSDSRCTAASPALPVGPVPVSVGDSPRINADLFTVAAPSLSSIAPRTGPDYGGTAVQLFGTGLSPTIGIDWGGTYFPIEGCLYLTNYMDCTIVSPTGTGTVNVSLQNGPQKPSNTFTYIAYPEGGYLTPSTGLPAGGTKVTAHGRNFSVVPGQTRFTFQFRNGNVPAIAVSCSSSTECAFATPPLQPQYSDPAVIGVSVSVGSKTGPSGAFKYANPPTPPLPPGEMCAQCREDGGHCVQVNGEWVCKGTLF